MSDKPSPPSLRETAETRLAEAPVEKSTRSAEELLHDLQVHQIELEMQNEALRQAQVELEESRDRYVDLYDFAPAGYLTLTPTGLIEQINLTGAALLGVERKKLLGRRFVNSIAPEDRDRWLRRFQRSLQQGDKQNCELAMRRGDGTHFHARIDCLRIDSGAAAPALRITLTDISEHNRAEEKLRNNEAQLRTIIENLTEGLAVSDLDGNLLHFNRAALDMHDFACIDECRLHLPEFADTFELTGMDGAVWPVDQWPLSRILRGEELRDLEGCIRHLKAGWRRIYNYGGTLVRDNAGKPLMAIVTIADISERKRAEKELRIAAIAFESQEGMMVTDSHGVIVRVNHAFTRLTGYRAEEAIGQTPALLRSGRHDKVFYDQMWQTLREKGYWQGEMWNKRKNGKIYAEWLTISAVTTPDGMTTHYVGTFSEITKNKEAQAEIHRLAYYDPLTHLPNRRLLMDRLAQAIAGGARSGRRGAVLFLDLDNFKSLNDTRGHAAGDLLLGEVARRLQSGVREGDTISRLGDTISRLGDTISRLGGDEFVMVLEDLSMDAAEAANQARQVGEKVREGLARPYDLEGREYHCTASLGVTLFLNHEESVETLLKQADLALYQAKDAGRNCLRFFDPAMQSALDARSALEADLRKALQLGQLLLHYQPQLDSTRRVIGAEALLRWRHPKRGLVAPDAFIPLAEESGLILPIGRWVLETACARIKAWSAHTATRDLRLAVNVSARQFRQAGFVAEVEQALRESGADPSRLKIELTESLVIDNVAETIARMRALKALGIGFSMDDFGTGFSSLSYLKRLPLEQLKIDRSFVFDLATDPNDAAIVQTIITMGRTLGLDVIAEGVETEAQLARLDQYGCTHFQGYLFSRPLPEEEFAAWLGDSTPL